MTDGGAHGGDSGPPRYVDVQCTPKKSSLPVVTAGTLDEVVFIRRGRVRKTPLSGFEGMRLMWAGFFFFRVLGYLGSFFRVFPLGRCSDPKYSGWRDNNRPFNRAKN